MIRASIVLLAILATSGVPASRVSSSHAAKETQAATPGPAVYIAYYWRAKPGQLEAYNQYIKTVAEPIDEAARRAGVFEEVRTVVPAPGVTVDWTHLRIFRLKDAAAADALGAGLDAAGGRVVPDEARRKANSERAATLRDAVRREVWTELR